MSTEVRRDDAAGRYEVVVDGAVAGYTEIKPRDGVLIMPHTLVDDAYAGQGLAKVLVTGALDDIRSRGERIKPLCPYVRSFLEKNPQYTDLVA
ncbi:GNAT family N-acetyltransferase [Aeromicrobium alkaliterrae]|uniref:N-acetyltransferase n=1 Tax=Aeromicrobium alkaliterrae TaxID=302168 RepID=A0ABP4W700_9ACTN